MTWRELRSYVHHLPRDSATYRAKHPEAARWGEAEYLLADIFDVIAVGNWQRQGKEGAPRPKPHPRPDIPRTRDERLNQRLAAFQARHAERLQRPEAVTDGR